MIIIAHKKMVENLNISVTLIAISLYLEAKFDNGYFILFFKQNWRRDGDFPNFHDFDCDFCYLEAKFDNGYFIFFLRYGSTILHKKFQVISSTNEGGIVNVFLQSIMCLYYIFVKNTPYGNGSSAFVCEPIFNFF